VAWVAWVAWAAWAEWVSEIISPAASLKDGPLRHHVEDGPLW